MSMAIHDERSLLISSKDIQPTLNRGVVSDSTEMSTELWDKAIGTLLDWSKHPHVDPKRWESALDFAYDQQESGAMPPSSMIATEDGDITFEWRSTHTLVMVEVIDSGTIEYTKLRDHRVVEEEIWHRDPRTRKLQIEKNNHEV